MGGSRNVRPVRHAERLTTLADQFRQLPPHSQSQQTTRMRPFADVDEGLGEHVSSLIGTLIVEHANVGLL